MRLNLGQDSKLSLVEILKLTFYGEAEFWSRFWRWNLIKICVWTCSNFGKQNSTLGPVVPLAMFWRLFIEPKYWILIHTWWGELLMAFNSCARIKDDRMPTIWFEFGIGTQIQWRQRESQMCLCRRPHWYAWYGWLGEKFFPKWLTNSGLLHCWRKLENSICMGPWSEK